MLNTELQDKLGNGSMIMCNEDNRKLQLERGGELDEATKKTKGQKNRRNWVLCNEEHEVAVAVCTKCAMIAVLSKSNIFDGSCPLGASKTASNTTKIFKYAYSDLAQWKRRRGATDGAQVAEPE